MRDFFVFGTIWKWAIKNIEIQFVTCSQNCIKLERQQAKTPYFKSKFIVFVFFGFKHFGCQSKNLFFSFISNRFFQKCHHSKSFDLLVFAKCTLKIKHYENHRIQNMLLSSWSQRQRPKPNEHIHCAKCCASIANVALSLSHLICDTICMHVRLTSYWEKYVNRAMADTEKKDVRIGKTKSSDPRNITKNENHESHCRSEKKFEIWISNDLFFNFQFKLWRSMNAMRNTCSVLEFSSRK